LCLQLLHQLRGFYELEPANDAAFIVYLGTEGSEVRLDSVAEISTCCLRQFAYCVVVSLARLLDDLSAGQLVGVEAVNHVIEGLFDLLASLTEEDITRTAGAALYALLSYHDGGRLGALGEGQVDTCLVGNLL
jgi:hypothetical protein